MLRWKNWRLKYGGVQDRAFRLCPVRLLTPQALFTRAGSTATNFSAEVEWSIFCMGRSWAEESVHVTTTIEAYALLDRDRKIRSCEQGLKGRWGVYLPVRNFIICVEAFFNSVPSKSPLGTTVFTHLEVTFHRKCGKLTEQWYGCFPRSWEI